MIPRIAIGNKNEKLRIMLLSIFDSSLHALPAAIHVVPWFVHNASIVYKYFTWCGIWSHGRVLHYQYFSYFAHFTISMVYRISSLRHVKSVDGLIMQPHILIENSNIPIHKKLLQLQEGNLRITYYFSLRWHGLEICFSFVHWRIICPNRQILSYLTYFL